jgi:circadian clock protein KaiC
VINAVSLNHLPPLVLTSESSERIQSGVPGLDRLIDGGIPRGNLVVLAGRAGTGKSVLGAQFVYYGSSVLRERTLYITFMEDKTRFIRNMKRFGIDLEEMESKGLTKVINFAIPATGQQSKIAEDIVRTFDEFKPTRAVIDPFSALSIPVNGSKNELQTFIHSLASNISSHLDCTTILICEVAANADQIGSGVEEYIADGIVVLYYLMRGKAKIKAVEIRKMRGTKHSNQAVLLEITDKGIVIDPDIELT